MQREAVPHATQSIGKHRHVGGVGTGMNVNLLPVATARDGREDRAHKREWHELQSLFDRDVAACAQSLHDSKPSGRTGAEDLKTSSKEDSEAQRNEVGRSCFHRDGPVVSGDAGPWSTSRHDVRFHIEFLKRLHLAPEERMRLARKFGNEVSDFHAVTVSYFRGVCQPSSVSTSMGLALRRS